jgi:hypothetical protein
MKRFVALSLMMAVFVVPLAAQTAQHQMGGQMPMGGQAGPPPSG